MTASSHRDQMTLGEAAHHFTVINDKFQEYKGSVLRYATSQTVAGSVANTLALFSAPA